MTNNHVLNFMLKHDGVPLTREKYLESVFMGNPPKEIDGELEEEIRDFGLRLTAPGSQDADLGSTRGAQPAKSSFP